MQPNIHKCNLLSNLHTDMLKSSRTHGIPKIPLKYGICPLHRPSLTILVQFFPIGKSIVLYCPNHRSTRGRSSCLGGRIFTHSDDRIYLMFGTIIEYLFGIICTIPKRFIQLGTFLLCLWEERYCLGWITNLFIGDFNCNNTMGFDFYNEMNLDPPFSDFRLRSMFRSEPITLLIQFQSTGIERNRNAIVRKIKRWKILRQIDSIDSFLDGGIMRNVKLIMRT